MRTITNIGLIRTIAKLAPPAMILCLMANAGSAQASKTRSDNNPFSPSPSPIVTPRTAPASMSTESSFTMQAKSQPFIELQPSPATVVEKKLSKVDIATLSPTEYYKIGVGDVLYVKLKNVDQPGSYVTVNGDGTIDYPLAGKSIVAEGNTTDNLGEILSANIPLFARAQVEVSVREFASHTVEVQGLAMRTGVKHLQREAVPLFVIRAEAGLGPKATKVIISRFRGQKTETFSLSEANADNIFIFPGDKVEFAAAPDLYFISGDVARSGQMDLTPGLTLLQALASAGGVAPNSKRAVIRRKDAKGILSATEYYLKNIKDGQVADPVLAVGDIIEIRK